MSTVLDQSGIDLIAEVERRVRARELGWVSRPSAPVCRIQTALYGIGLSRGQFATRRYPSDLSQAYGLIWDQRAHALVVKYRSLLMRCGLVVHIIEWAEGLESTLVHTGLSPLLVVHATCTSSKLSPLPEPAPELAPEGQV